MWDKFFYKIKKLNRQLNHSLGYILIALGIIIFVMYIPTWLWMLILGVGLVMLGYYVNMHFR
ncbi:hypothetical protein TKV_c14100 [Thermoanaerobacter kivui]|uniref:Uncharacterized protein n=1 Tax=Thermoanaerobacter kivui TaxID=2325 RepID=A0A097ARY1_THEKI|nr:hypothetical protein [Thermoanaerobacter kivui]AIS52581.1 hypothetical protein TKV_c14100 [Thermoanaerobacter kivui]